MDTMDTVIREAYYLADDNHEYGRGWSPAPASGWWYDGRGAKTLERNFAPYPLANISGDAPTALIRELRKTSEGVVTVLTAVRFNAGFDGLVIRLYDTNKDDACCLYTKNGCYYALTKGQKDVLLKKEENPLGVHYFKIVINFDEKKVSYHIDNAFVADVPLTAKYIKFYKIGTLAGHILDIVPGDMHIHANYAVNERFMFNPSDCVPEGWIADCEDDASVRVAGDNLELSSENMTQATVYKELSPIKGNQCFESFFFMPTLQNGARITLSGSGKILLTFSVEDGDFCADGKHLRYALGEMWYRLRFEFDLDKKTAIIKVNGKKAGIAKIPKCEGIDRIEYSLCAENALLLVDYIRLFPMIEYEDYCPKPVLPKGKNDYVIGMNMCSLWHTGSHIGWDVITPYPEIKPVIGYYDEGLPEVADWEIKFMLEHGVDFQLYCWYASKANAPMKTTVLSEAIHDGYFNCKYSEMSRFALLWEAANAAKPDSLESFKRYYVPYWIEQFFSDDRYMRIENKAIMAVFGSSALINALGSPEVVHEAFDYLRAEVSKLGYDGMIIMACGAPSEELKNCGFDAAYAYGWGKQGYDPDFITNAVRAQQSLDIIHVVPTASTGFNNVAWAETRSPSITAEDFKKVHTVFRDEMLPSFKDKPSWTHNFVMCSNWNEFGEGTYIMPCKGLNGFGYLDALLDVYTKENSEDHTDAVPTPNQLSRLSYLYPQDRKMIRTQGYYTDPVPDKVLTSFDFNRFGKGDLDKYFGRVTCDAKLTETGAIVGTSHSADPQIILRDKCSLDFRKIDGYVPTHIRLRGKVNKPCGVELFYTTESEPFFSQSKAFGFSLSPEKSECTIRITKRPTLAEPITGLRIDPADIADIDFELYGVDLLVDVNKPLFFLDGESQPINSPVQIKDGYTLFPFNPYHVLVYKLGLYYEYSEAKKQLSFYSKDCSVKFRIGSRTAFINGEKRLLDVRIETFDGLPMLPLEIMSKVFGFKFTYNAPRLDITTK